MAKKSESAVSFNTLMSEIRAGRYAPVYLLSGDEPFFIDAITDALQQRVVPDEEARDFDLTVFFGADSSIDDVAGAARRFPVMGSRQLIMLKELQAMNDGKGQLNRLAPVAAAPSQTTVLVITYKGEPIKATHEFVKAVNKGGGVVFQSMKLREWELNAHITDYCRSKKVTIDGKAAEMLKDYVGNDLSRLSRDIDKLIVAGGGSMITPEMIEENIGISKDFNNFELIKAISLRNYAKSMQIVDYFERNPKQNPVVMTVSILFRYFSQLMLAHYAPDKSDRGLQVQLGLSSVYQLTDVKAGMQRFTPASAMRVIHALRKLDARSKGIGSMMKDYALLRQFVYEAFTL